MTSWRLRTSPILLISKDVRSKKSFQPCDPRPIRLISCGSFIVSWWAAFENRYRERLAWYIAMIRHTWNFLTPKMLKCNCEPLHYSVFKENLTLSACASSVVIRPVSPSPKWLKVSVPDNPSFTIPQMNESLLSTCTPVLLEERERRSKID